MKDSIGPVAIGTGTSFQLTPSLLLQIFGILIAIWGGWYTRKRFIESERANDLNEERLRWEMRIHAKNESLHTGERDKLGNKEGGEENL